MNICLLFFSFFQLVMTDPFIIKEEETTEYYVEETDHYQLKEQGKMKMLFFENELIAEFSPAPNVHLLENNQKIFVFVYQEENIQLHCFHGRELQYTVILPGHYLFHFDVCWFGDDILLAGGIISDQVMQFSLLPHQQKDNAVIHLMDQAGVIKQTKIFGGYENEGFLKVEEQAGDILIWGWKEYQTGGDLGNGGNRPTNHFLLKVDAAFQKQNIAVFSEYEILTFGFFDQQVICCTNERLYLLNSDLNTAKSFKFPSQSHFATLTPHNLCIVMLYEKMIIYDVVFFSKLYECFFNSDFTRVTYGLDEIFLHKNEITKLNIYDFRFFQSPIAYSYLEKQTVYDLMGPVLCPVKEITPYFEPQIHGIYQVHYLVDTMEITADLQMEAKCNVSEGMIYPCGYYLDFSGVAYLNNQLIAKNHRLEEGMYHLTISDCVGNTETIQFSVDQKQFYFQESEYLAYDKAVEINQSVFLHVPQSDSYQLAAVLVNGEWEEPVLNDAGYQIEKKFPSTGLHTVLLEALKVNIVNHEVIIPCYHFYQIMVLAPGYQVATTITEKSSSFKIKMTIADPHYTLRGFITRISGFNGISETIHPLGDKKWTFTGLERNHLQQVEVLMLSEMGDKTRQYSPVVTLTLQPLKAVYYFGDMRIVRSSQFLEEVEIDVFKKDIISMTDHQGLFYRREKEPLAIWIGSGIVFGGTGAFIITMIKKKKKGG